MITMEIPQLMAEQYHEAKKMIDESEDIKVYSHIDCDGICSGAILSTILDRQNKAHEIEFVNLDVLDDIDLDHELTPIWVQVRELIQKQRTHKKL